MSLGLSSLSGSKICHLETRQSPWDEVGFGALRPSSVLQLGELMFSALSRDSCVSSLTPHPDSVAAGSSFPP